MEKRKENKTDKTIYIVSEVCGKVAVTCVKAAIGFFAVGLGLKIWGDVRKRRAHNNNKTN